MPKLKNSDSADKARNADAKLLRHCFICALLLSCLFIFPCIGYEAHAQVQMITLQDAIERVLGDNRQLESAAQKVDLADLQIVLNEAEFDLRMVPNGNAGYIGGGKAGAGPTVAGGLEFNKKFQLGTRICIKPMVIKAAKAFQSQLNAKITQPLLRGFGKFENTARLETTRFLQRGALRNLLIAQANTILKTIQTVYDVKRSEEMVVLEKEGFERLKLFWQKTQRKEKMGLCDALDVYRAEMEYQQSQSALVIAEERFEESKDQLNDLLENTIDLPIAVSVPLDVHPIALTEEDAIAIALQYRIEVYQAWDQLQENRRQSKLACARTQPELNLVADFSNTGWNEVFTESFYKRRESTWGIGLESSTDIERTAEKIAYKQSLLAVKDAERAYADAQDAAIMDVKKVIRTVTSLNARRQSIEEQMRSAKGGLALAKIKYDRGMCSNFDVIQAEKAYQNAQLLQLGAMFEHILIEYKLLAAMGMLANSSNITICNR